MSQVSVFALIFAFSGAAASHAAENEANQEQ
jgi:hypothetical protein